MRIEVRECAWCRKEARGVHWWVWHLQFFCVRPKLFKHTAAVVCERRLPPAQLAALAFDRRRERARPLCHKPLLVARLLRELRRGHRHGLAVRRDDRSQRVGERAKSAILAAALDFRHPLLAPTKVDGRHRQLDRLRQLWWGELRQLEVDGSAGAEGGIEAEDGASTHVPVRLGLGELQDGQYEPTSRSISGNLGCYRRGRAASWPTPQRVLREPAILRKPGEHLLRHDAPIAVVPRLKQPCITPKPFTW